MREEEGDPDEGARRVGGGAGKGGASEQRRQVGPGAQGERATRGGGAAACWVERRAGEWAERWRVARGKSERGGGELGRGTGLGFGLGLVSLFYSISFLFSIPNANKV